MNNQILHRLGYSLSLINSCPWEKVSKIWLLCPKLSSTGCVITNDEYNAVVSLGIYFLNSGFYHEDKIIPYLLKLVEQLPKCIFKQSKVAPKNEVIPLAEKFAFTFATLLSDIATRLESARHGILDALIKTIINLVDSLTKTLSDSNELDNQSSFNVYVHVTPLLIGYLRAFGRFSSGDTPLLQLLYPKMKPDYGGVSYRLQEKNSKNVKRTLSSGSVSSVDVSAFGSSSSLGNKQMDFRTHFFCKLGSSFNQYAALTVPRDTSTSISISDGQLKELLDNLKRLSNNEFQTNLDKASLAVYNSKIVDNYPYRSVSETVNLAVIGCFREILHSKPDLPASFLKDVYQIVGDLFKNGSAELSRENRCDGEAKSPVDRYKLNVQLIGACIDALVWAVSDEVSAESLAMKLVERIQTKAQFELPLHMTCLEALGKLAEKFPRCSNNFIIGSLKDFLIAPSSILVALERQADSFGSSLSSSCSIRSDRANCSALAAVNCLCEASVRSLCLALKAGQEVEKNATKALIFSVSNRIITNKEQERSEVLATRNSVMFLGRLALSCDNEKVADEILSLFQTQFGSGSLERDKLIMEQMGRMAVGNIGPTFTDSVLRFLTSVAVEGAHLSYTPPGTIDRKALNREFP
ncbi:phosphatidylinositol 4-kinase alpha-like [Artemia franciscana]